MHNGVIMPSEVAYLVDTERTFPVIQVSGVFAASDVVEVRNAILAVLATQPEALVIDVGAVRLEDSSPGGLHKDAVRLEDSSPVGPHKDAVRLEDSSPVGLLKELAGETAAWPATRIVLCTTQREQWIPAGLPVCPDRQAAFDELGEPHPDTRRQLRLDPVVSASRRAREFVSEVCDQWECPEVRGPACIVVTEMVNNVVAHVRSEMTVLLAKLGDTVSVAVRDRSTTIPRFVGPVAPTAYGGRGLLLIDSVSDSWGNLSLGDGKVVWSLLADEPAGRREAESRIPDPTRG